MEASQGSFDELPEFVFVPLGTRGVERIKLKQCQHCLNDDLPSLRLVERSVKDASENQDTVSYLVLCEKCNLKFTLRCRNIYSSGHERRTRIISFVSVLDEEGKDQGWLGNF